VALEKAAGKVGSGVAILVSAGIVYEIIAAACSSPQTTHINAASRADTLMFWVYIGEVQAALFVGLAAYFDRRFAKEYILGGVGAGVIMHCSYVYAKNAGLADNRPGTETY
jgi:hypothetical protein